MSNPGKREFVAGEVIFHQGEMSTDLYHIQTGRVAISITRVGAEVILAELGPGSLFGEMAIINGPPRTATATALEPVMLNVISEEVFREKTVGLPPWALAIARVLADRLRNTTASLDRLLYDQSHAVPGPTALGPSSLSIVPQDLEITTDPADPHRIFLSGTLDSQGLDGLLNRVNTLRRQGVSPVILSFSNVVDAQRRALEAVVELARSSTAALGLVQLENVQLIADRLTGQQGLQGILTSDQTPVRRVGYDEYLMRQGETGTEMYVVKSGTFTISRRIKDKEIILWTAQEGDVIGEMALISGKTRTASVLAQRTSQVYVIDTQEFVRNAYHLPRWFKGIIEGLVSRLRNTNVRLDEFVTGNLQLQNVQGLLGLEILENVRKPGICALRGSLTAATLKDLKTYVGHRVRSGVREFRFDTTMLTSLDQVAGRYLVQLNVSLLNIRGRLKVHGSQPLTLPEEL